MSAQEKYFDSLTKKQKRGLTLLPKDPYPEPRKVYSQQEIEKMAQILISLGYIVTKP